MMDHELQANAMLTRARKALRDVLEQDGMTARNIAAFTGVHYSSLSRFKDGKTITAENFLKLSLWLESLASHSKGGE